MPTTLWNELREVLWLVSVVGGLSTLGVVLAVAAAVTGSVWRWQNRSSSWERLPHSWWPPRLSSYSFNCIT